jgi:cell wall-associated NlpC family hydrolase
MLSGYLTASYRDGGRGPDAFDCLGLFLAVQRDRFGRDLPDPAVLPGMPGHDGAASLLGDATIEVTDIQAGDALLFKMSLNFLHVATAISARDMIHIQRGSGCTIEPIGASKWRARLIGAFRFVEDHPSRSAPPPAG